MDTRSGKSNQTSSTNVTVDEVTKSLKNKPTNRGGRKRKRCSSDSSSDNEDVLPENTLEVEKNIHASAIKNNLDDVSVKKILKKVVTNDHVLALVKLREEEEDSGPEEPNIKPKLTRAKVKELKKASPNGAPWNLENLELIPIKHIPVKTTPEVEALIAQELPEDEDDEEYEPTNDDVPSDDDHGMESCSDLDSLPQTPATPVAAHEDSPRVVNDGPFKLPQEVTPARRKLELNEEEATIALRTRSKLSLSSIPLEHIESSFVPPDELPPDIDHLWNEFLAECLNPGPSNKNEDDDEADPEYNVAADLDANEEDEEALENSIIKISKKELNDLVTELFNVMPDVTPEHVSNDYMEQNNGAAFNSNMNDLSSQNHWKGKQEPMTEDDELNKTMVINAEENYRNQFSCQVEVTKMESNHNDTTINHPADIYGKSFMTNNINETSNLQTGTINMVTSKTTEMSTFNRDETLNCQVHITNNTNQMIKPQVNSVMIGENSVESSIQKLEINIQHVQNSKNIAEGAKDQNTCPNMATQIVQRCSNKKARKPGNKKARVHITVKECRIAAKPAPTPPTPVTIVQKKNDCEVEIHIDKPIKIVPQQLMIMQQQIRQHIQLAASNFLQICVHPEHWSRAPLFKEFLEALYKMVEKNSQSVVNVCNLKPAIELVNSWESSVSKDTTENKEMVEFMQKEIERCQRKASSNKLHLGNFHPTFMKVVANSPVFLYPYLLPAMPYKNDVNRRYIYTRSEDAMIALGLDQFWNYVESNPDLYPKRIRHYKQRWGIAHVVGLISKHMMPWYYPRLILWHIRHMRYKGDKSNPIREYFEKQAVTPVKHHLLPFNPKLTLYEQPEHEMPRIWVQYLAKTSKRFKDYYRRRLSSHMGVKPAGVIIEMDKEVELPKKTALPVQYTEPIPGCRAHLPTPRVESTDRIDIHIDKSNAITDTVTAPPPIATAANIFRIVQTSTGAILVPLQVAQTTDTAQPQINSTAETNICTTVPSDIIENSNLTNTTNAPVASTEKDNGTKVTTDKDHCKCCVSIRKICKQRQSTIAEFFIPNNKYKMCPCKEVKKYPKITNKLRLLSNSYKNSAQRLYQILNMEKLNIEDNTSDKQNEVQWSTNDNEANDLTFVNAYQLKLNVRTTLARNAYIKRRVYILFNRFNPETDDPVTLAIDLEKAFGTELVDIYKETLAFLTPEQADRLGKFIDYFTHSCLEDVIKKVHEHVHDANMRQSILAKLGSTLADRVSTPCELCANLILVMAPYPTLARYVFSLFPHRCKERSNKIITNAEKIKQCQNERSLEKRATNPQTVEPVPSNEVPVQKDASQIPMDCTDDHLSSDEVKIAIDIAVQPQTNGNEIKLVDVPQVQTETTIHDDIIDTPELTKIKAEVQYSEPDTAMIAVLDGKPIKTEVTEWSREDDKVLLETLKRTLTPEERVQKTVLELIDDSNTLEMISETLTDKSTIHIRERLKYLLNLLINGNKD